MRKRVARMTVRCRKHKEGCKEQFTTGDDAINVIAHRKVCRFEVCTAHMIHHQFSGHHRSMLLT